MVTELKSGNNIVHYEYDGKRRKTKVGLNGNEEYLKTDYLNGTGDHTDSDVAGYVEKAVTTNAKNETFTAVTDRKDRLRKKVYGTTTQVVNQYDSRDRLSSSADSLGDTLSYEYDSLDRLKTIKAGSVEREAYTYDAYGNQLTKTVFNGLNHSYVYGYRDDSSRELKSISVSGMTVGLASDPLKRKSEKTVSGASGVTSGEYYYYSKYGDHATNRISTIRYGDKKNGAYVIGDSVKYAYDSMGNISKIFENGETTVSYEYDALGRLVGENNVRFGKTTLWTYDNNGNIQSKRVYAYCVRPTEEIFGECDRYDYYYAGNSDQLLQISSHEKVNNVYVDKIEKFEYDAIGNPTKYKSDVANVTWTKGREMVGFAGTTFTYNGRGQRILKRKGTETAVSFTYDAGGNMVKQSNGLEFYYDEAGVCGLKYGGTDYVYRKNVQGDITNILDMNGTIVVKYVYDGWGNHKGYNADGSECTTGIGVLNPFRYRSYYYDTETKLYFLKSRYCDPETGRFLTIDDTEYLDPETINGLNLYAYCGNNPVMRVDPNGTNWWTDFWNGTWGKVIGTVLVVVGVVVLSIVTAGVGGAIATAVGGGMFGAIVGGAAAGAISGAIFGAGFSLLSQGLTNGYGNVNLDIVLRDTAVGMFSGAIMGGMFGALNFVANGGKVIADGISRFTEAQVEYYNAASILKNAIKIAGGSMAPSTIAYNTFNIANIHLQYAQKFYNFIYYSYKTITAGIKFGLNSFFKKFLKGWV